MTDYTYEFHYFGNANWPSDYTWRVDADGRKWLLMERAVPSLALAKFEWEETGTERDSDPFTTLVGSDSIYVGWWRDLGDKTDETYAWSLKASMGPSPWGLEDRMVPLS